MEALAAGEDVRASAVLRDDRVFATGQVHDAMRLLDHGADAVAVTAADDVLVGWVRHRDVLAALSGGQDGPTTSSVASESAQAKAK